MKKIDKEIFESVLADYPQLDLPTRAEIISKAEAEQEAAKEPPLPKEPKQFVIVALSEDENIAEIPMYIVQTPESVPHVDVVKRIKEAAAEHNLTRKGMKIPVETIANAMGDVKRKLLTERDISVKTKEPVIIVNAVNAIDFDAMVKEAE
jgi:hypothetical protein